MRRSLADCFELIDNLRVRAVVALLLASVQTAALVPIALVIRRVFDHDIPANDHLGILVAGVIIAGCYSVSALSNVAGRTYAARVTKEAVGAIREKLIRKVCGLPMSWHDRNAAGAVHAIVIQDCERVDRMVNMLMSMTLPGVLIAAALAVVAAVINPLLFGVVLIALPAILLATRRFERVFARRLKTWHERAHGFSAHAEQLLRGIATIRAAGAEDHEVARFNREIEGFVSAGCQSAVAGSRFVAMEGAVATVAGVAVLVVGGVLVAGHRMQLGSLLAFYAVVALILRQTSVVLGTVPTILEGGAAASRVKLLLATDEAHAYAGRRQIEFGGRIELRRVTLGYHDRLALQDVSLVITPGEQVAVVGSNGAGKTTLMAVMLGFYTPSSGMVLADGVALSDLDLPAFRRQIGVVLQDAMLFPGTILENITMGAPGLRRETVLEATDISGAADFIEALPEGFDTRLTDGGVGLSGGQRQQIAIARALVGRPSLLLMDEPTASLSGQLGDRLVKNLRKLSWQPAVMLITHDIAIAAQAQRVLRLDAGRLIADTSAEIRPGPAWLAPIAASVASA